MNKNITKKTFCSNCNQSSHDYRDCPEPITSWGIILVNLSMIPFDIQHLKTNIKSHIFNITPTTLSELHVLSEAMSSIKFLLVQRKHSLGYVDFLRGKYRIDNIDGINFLFQHMNHEEINKIKSESFDNLWKNLWNNDEEKLNHIQKEYLTAKQKFETLQNSAEIELNLDFYINNVEPLYKFNEWGFPKGRKSKFENPKDCAIREFSEETNIPVEKINLIEMMKPIEENLIGTNGIKYRHIYYIAEIKEDFLPEIKDNNEIRDLNYFSYNDAISVIRDYHIDKKEVLTSVYYYYLEIIMNTINNSLLDMG
jgi:ADP-ribose pyrophosphatase YjhB (NUDIX family)